MTDGIDAPGSTPGRARLVALVFTAAPLAAAFLGFAAPALTARVPVGGSGSAVRLQPVTVQDPDPCHVTVEWPAAYKVPNCAGD